MLNFLDPKSGLRKNAKNRGDANNRVLELSEVWLKFYERMMPEGRELPDAAAWKLGKMLPEVGENAAWERCCRRR